jgi:hypothetical protein
MFEQVSETALQLTGQPIEFWFLTALGAAALVVAWFRADDRQETRRRRSIRASAKCESIGLGRLSALFEAYAVGDYTGSTRELRKIASYLRSAGGPEEVATSVIEAAGPRLIDDPVYGERIRKALAPKAPVAAAKRPATGDL